MAVKTKDSKNRFIQALQEMEKIRRNPVVSIGIQGQEAKAMHTGDVEEGVSDVTVVEVGTFNEFGTIHIPERSFIRSTMDENRAELLRDTRKLFYQIAMGKVTTKKALKILGLKIENLIKKKITDLKTPPNAPATIRKKKSSNPLIDSGQMRQSITNRLKMGRVK